MRIINSRTGEILANRTMVAESEQARRTGLLDRDCLEPGDGLLIVPGNAIHTIGMHFPIAVAFLKGTEILRCWNVPPGWSRVACDGADSVLELPCGALDRSRPGDRLIHAFG
jgi:uncharacterized protein